jgi:hypothetical protein
MDTLPLRSNTSFIKQLYETLKKIPHSKSDPLQYHQRLVVEYLTKSQVRGIIAFHQMGSGKSILAVACCESLSENYKVLFIASKSLHNNFIKEIKKFLKLSGDTRTEEQIEAHIKKHYTFISSNASNMIKQVYKSQTIEDSNYFADPENSNIKDQLDRLGNLENTFVVIEEAHNFFNSVTNGSKNAVELYDLMMQAKQIKMLFLTGSFITNDPFECGIAYNLLSGYTDIKNKLTLFGEDYEDFIKYFVHNPNALRVEDEPTTTAAIGVEQKRKLKLPMLQNREKFTNRIVGLTSYYGTDQGDIKKLFPTQLDTIIERIPMSARQYALYSAARDKEMEETKRGAFKQKKAPLQKPQGASSSYRVRSRQLSNFVFPRYASSSRRDEHGFVHFETYLDKLKPETFDIKPIKKIKNIEETDDIDFGIETWSPKFLKMLKNISKHVPKGILDKIKELQDQKIPESKTPGDKKNQKNQKNQKDQKKPKSGKPIIGPGLIYSQFIESGLKPFGKLLEHYGFKQVIDSAQSSKVAKNAQGTYAIISGEVPIDIRSELLKLYNSPDNRFGEIITLLLISSTGAEGLDTKGTMHEHAMEPYWHYARLDQFYARGVRLGSHEHLDPEYKFVQPYLYLSDYPNIFEAKEQQKMKMAEDTTDVTLYYKSIQNQILIDSFRKAIQESSIDCMIHYPLDSEQAKLKSIRCKMCSPTNELLFLPDLDKDILSKSNCQPLQESKIKAQTIILTVQETGCKGDECVDKEYMYYVDSSTTTGSKIKPGVHILEFNSHLNGYQEIFEDHPDYFILFEKITKKLKKGK